MQECLKKGAEGRKYAVAIGQLPYSGDLANQLLGFSTKLESVYRKMSEVWARNDRDPKSYRKYVQILDEQLAWFVKAEAGVSSRITSFLYSCNRRYYLLENHQDGKSM